MSLLVAMVFILASAILVTADFSELSVKLKEYDESNPSISNQNRQFPCVDAYSKLIRLLPIKVQELVIHEYIAANMSQKNSTTCCSSSALTNRIHEYFMTSEISKIFSLYTDLSIITKDSLVSFLGSEYVKLILGEDLELEEKAWDMNLINSTLHDINTLNSKYLKCFNKVYEIFLHSLSFLCEKTPNKDFINQDVSGIKDILDFRKQVEESCEDYVDLAYELQENVSGAFVNQLNKLLDTDKCNYFSSQFSFDQELDAEDTYFPKKILKRNEEKLKIEEMKFGALLKKFETCQRNSELPEIILNNFVDKVEKSQKTNPNGLSTYIGRGSIDFSIIKKTFYLRKFPRFFVSCRFQTCTAYCEKCDTLIWEKEKVVKDKNLLIEVSCCSNTCGVFIETLDENTLTTISGSELFFISSESDLREVDDLLLEKLTNVKNSQNSTIVQGLIENLVKNPENYVIDLRLGSSLLLNLEETSSINSTKTLQNLIHGDLMKTGKNFTINCKDSICVQTLEHDSQRFEKEYRLKTNKNVHDSIMESIVSNSTISSEIVKNSSLRILRRSGGSRSGGRSSGGRSSGGRSSGGRSSGGRSSGGSRSGSSSSSRSSRGSTSFSGRSSSSTRSNARGHASSSKISSKGSSVLTRSPSRSNSISSSTRSKQGSALTRTTSWTSRSTKGGSALTTKTQTSSTTQITSKGGSQLTTPLPTKSVVASNINTNQRFSTGSIPYTLPAPTRTQTYYKPTTRSFETVNYRPIQTTSVTYTYRQPIYSTYGYSYGVYYYPHIYSYNNYYIGDYHHNYYQPTRYTYYNNRYFDENGDLFNINPHTVLPALYNSADWMPSFEKPYTPKDLIDLLDKANLYSNLRINVSCGSYFCINLVELDNFDLDDISSQLTSSSNSTNKKHVFLDIFQTSKAFIDIQKLSISQRICVVEHFLTNQTINDTSTEYLKTLSKCNIAFPFTILPVKKSCHRSFNEFVKSSFLNETFARFFKQSTSIEKENSCTIPQSCLSNSTESKNYTCGGELMKVFFKDSFSIDLSGLNYRCSERVKNLALNDTELVTKTISNDSVSSLSADFDSLEQYGYIDESTSLQANQDIKEDLKRINFFLETNQLEELKLTGDSKSYARAILWIMVIFSIILL